MGEFTNGEMSDPYKKKREKDLKKEKGYLIKKMGELNLKQLRIIVEDFSISLENRESDYGYNENRELEKMTPEEKEKKDKDKCIQIITGLINASATPQQIQEVEGRMFPWKNEY